MRKGSPATLAGLTAAHMNGIAVVVQESFDPETGRVRVRLPVTQKCKIVSVKPHNLVVRTASAFVPSHPAEAKLRSTGRASIDDRWEASAIFAEMAQSTVPSVFVPLLSMIVDGTLLDTTVCAIIESSETDAPMRNMMGMLVMATCPISAMGERATSAQMRTVRESVARHTVALIRHFSAAPQRFQEMLHMLVGGVCNNIFMPDDAAWCDRLAWKALFDESAADAETFRDFTFSQVFHGTSAGIDTTTTEQHRYGALRCLLEMVSMPPASLLSGSDEDRESCEPRYAPTPRVEAIASAPIAPGGRPLAEVLVRFACASVGELDPSEWEMLQLTHTMIDFGTGGHSGGYAFSEHVSGEPAQRIILATLKSEASSRKLRPGVVHELLSMLHTTLSSVQNVPVDCACRRLVNRPNALTDLVHLVGKCVVLRKAIGGYDEGGVHHTLQGDESFLKILDLLSAACTLPLTRDAFVPGTPGRRNLAAALALAEANRDLARGSGVASALKDLYAKVETLTRAAAAMAHDRDPRLGMEEPGTEGKIDRRTEGHCRRCMAVMHLKALKRCARCGTYYCSLKCQKEDWRGGHKQFCAARARGEKEMKEIRKTTTSKKENRKQMSNVSQLGDGVLNERLVSTCVMLGLLGVTLPTERIILVDLTETPIRCAPITRREFAVDVQSFEGDSGAHTLMVLERNAEAESKLVSAVIVGYDDGRENKMVVLKSLAKENFGMMKDPEWEEKCLSFAKDLTAGLPIEVAVGSFAFADFREACKELQAACVRQGAT